MDKLEGKMALVTGGTSGIGLATAKQFVNEGAHVFITGRRDVELTAAVREIGRNVTGVQGDVSNLDDLDRLFAQIKREKGKLDIVFANAGIAKFARLGTITEEFYDSIFNTNVKGLLFTVQKALPLLPDGASIILSASVAGSKGRAANGVYSATKAAVRSFARTWTMDLKDRHIRVNAVSPGVIETPGLSGLLASSEQSGAATPEDDSTVFRLAGSANPTRSPRPWCFSPPTTAATSREQNCLWMAALHKCRPFIFWKALFHRLGRLLGKIVSLGGYAWAFSCKQRKRRRSISMSSQQTEQSSWQRAVRVIKPDQFDSNTPQAAGMQRLSAVSKQVADTRGIWAGVTDVQAHVGTGKHHHGDQETIIYVVTGSIQMTWGDQLEFQARCHGGRFHLCATLRAAQRKKCRRHSFHNGWLCALVRSQLSLIWKQPRPICR